MKARAMANGVGIGLQSPTLLTLNGFQLIERDKGAIDQGFVAQRP